jgi:hypothetical protein
MKRVRNVIVCVAVIAIGATAGCLIAWLAHNAFSFGTFAFWQPLPVLPETASHIFAIPQFQSDPETTPVYIQTVSNKVLVCCTATEPIWAAVSKPPVEYRLEPCEGAYQSASKMRFTNLPSAITACARARQSWEWVLHDAYFVILADNSVWRWQRHVGIDRLFVFVFSGSGLGMLIAISAMSIFRRGRPRA